MLLQIITEVAINLNRCCIQCCIFTNLNLAQNWFSVEIFGKIWFLTSFWVSAFQLSVQFDFSRDFRLKLSLNCNFSRIFFEDFQHEILFSFQFSRKTFLLKLSVNMMRKINKKSVCVSSENTLYTTGRGFAKWRKIEAENFDLDGT